MILLILKLFFKKGTFNEKGNKIEWKKRFYDKKLQKCNQMIRAKYLPIVTLSTKILSPTMRTLHPPKHSSNFIQTQPNPHSHLQEPFHLWAKCFKSKTLKMTNSYSEWNSSLLHACNSCKSVKKTLRHWESNKVTQMFWVHSSLQ
jgi:hypothetical protein